MLSGAFVSPLRELLLLKGESSQNLFFFLQDTESFAVITLIQGCQDSDLCTVSIVCCNFSRLWDRCLEQALVPTL